MTSRTAQRIVLASLVSLVAIRTIQRARDSRGTALVSPRELFGAIGLSMALSALSEPAPEVAAGFATMAAITGTIAAGPDLFRRQEVNETVGDALANIGGAAADQLDSPPVITNPANPPANIL